MRGGLKDENEQCYRYEAFVSYSHSEQDAAVARAIQRFLERYTIPRALRERAGRARLGKVFRDEDDLAAGSSLSERLQQAIEDSLWLIAVCSPAAAASQWVNREIETFIARHGRERVLTVLAAGEPGEAFPPALTAAREPSEVFSLAQGVSGEENAKSRSAAVTDALQDIEPHDAVAAPQDTPLAADLRGATRRREQRRELLRIAATLIGCNYDDLVRRQRRRVVRRATVIAVTATMLISIVVSVLFDAWQAKRANDAERLAADSTQLLADGRRMESIQSALDALDIAEGTPAESVAELALEEALGVYPGVTLMSPLYALDDVGDATNLVVSQTGGWFVYTNEADALVFRDLETGAQLCVVSEMETSDGERTSVDSNCIDLNGVPVVTFHSGLYMVAYDLQTGEQKWFIDTSGIMWRAIELSDGKAAALIQSGFTSADVIVFDVTTGSVEQTIETDLFDEGYQSTRLTAYEDVLFAVSEEQVASIDLSSGSVSYASLNLDGLTHVKLTDEMLVVMLNEEQEDESDAASQRREASLVGYKLGSWEKCFERELTWRPTYYGGNESFYGNAILWECAYSYDFEKSVALISAGSNLYAVDLTSGELLVEATAPSTVVYANWVYQTERDLIRVTCFDGSRLILDVSELEAGFVQMDSYRYPERVWDVEEIQLDGVCYGIACSADSLHTVFVYADDLDAIPNGPDVEQMGTYIVRSFAITDDRSLAAVVSSGGDLILFDVQESQAVLTVDLSKLDIDIEALENVSASFVNGESLAINLTASDEYGVPHIWQVDSSTGDLLRAWSWPYADDDKDIGSCNISKDRAGNITVLLPRQGYIAVIDSNSLEAKQEITVKFGDSDWIVDLWYPRSDRILLILYSGNVVLYEAESGERIRGALDELSVNASFGTCPVECSPDGRYLAIVAADGRLVVVDMDTGSSSWESVLDNASNAYIAYSADGDVIAARDGSGVLRLFDAHTGVLLGLFGGLCGLA